MLIPFRVFVNAGQRAMREGLPYAISRANIPPIPDQCPVCGIEMAFGRPNRTSPSLDKVIPALGYVPENVRWICVSCNSRKGAKVNESSV